MPFAPAVDAATPAIAAAFVTAAAAFFTVIVRVLHASRVRPIRFVVVIACNVASHVGIYFLSFVAFD
jgi:Na+-transporting NADH:ubiquinone oxidoreductase subunit NqrD